MQKNLYPLNLSIHWVGGLILEEIGLFKQDLIFVRLFVDCA